MNTLRRLFLVAALAFAGPILGQQIVGNLTVQQYVRNADGTAGAPSYRFTSDPDTGVYSAGANILGFATAGVEAGRFTSTGFVLPGTLTIGGVTSTGATGTGNLVFSASPTFTGTVLGAALNFSGAGANTIGAAGSVTTYNGAVASTSTSTGTIVISGAGGLGVGGNINSGGLTGGVSASNIGDVVSWSVRNTSSSGVGVFRAFNDTSAVAANSVDFGVGNTAVGAPYQGYGYINSGANLTGVRILTNGTVALTVGAAGALTLGTASSITAAASTKLDLSGGAGSLGVKVAGTDTNDAADAGDVGQLISAQRLVASTLGLTTTAAADVTTISLTAGDWDVWGTVHFIPANTTVVASLIASVSATTATQASVDSVGGYASIGAVYTSAGATMSATPIPVRVSLAATTTYYLVATGTFSISTCTAYGTIRARRLR